MTQANANLRPGDLVEVRSPDEILKTLDADGTLDKLPFMPEMIPYCGKRFRVLRRVVKTCTSGTQAGSGIRVFRTDDVFLLDGLRCSGADHEGCQKACTIFWREAWLRRVDDLAPQQEPSAESAHLRAQLKTKRDASIYFCQASELLNATSHMARPQRFTTCLKDISAGTCGPWEMAHRISIWLVWKLRRLLLGPYGRGTNKSTPIESLQLLAGECVEVKPMGEITKTLNERAHNRGLWFSPDMRLLCGSKQKVEKKVEKLIVDGTGEMRQLRNTVFLEGSYCSCPHVAFGGCSRGEYVYWREIWLRRAPDSR